MSEDSSDESGGGSNTVALKQLLMFGGIGLILLVGIISLFLSISIAGDFAALGDLARKNAKATKAIQDELVALKESLKSPPAPPAAAPDAPAAMDAVDTQRDCVVRSGDKGAVANCMGIEPKATAKPH